jgi:hypothetical protein
MNIPVPNSDQQEVIVDAWDEVLGQVLAKVQDDFEQHCRLIKAEHAAAAAEARAMIGQVQLELERQIAEKLQRLRQRLDDIEGPRITDYVEGKITYHGQLVTHAGGCWQARCDTAKSPSYDCSDWHCVAAAGLDGRSPRVRGTWDPADQYSSLDIVASSSASFIAKRSNPGPCPGEGWQIIALPGKRGKQGERGERGERGPPGASLSHAEIDPARYTLALHQSDRTTTYVSFRSMFEQYDAERRGS